MTYKQSYYRSCGYAFHLNKYLYKDLVHDAWVKYFCNTGNDLFNESPYFIAKAIRYAYQDIWGKEYYMKDGVRYQRQFVVNDSISHSMTPEKILISQEFCQEFFKRIDSYESPNNQKLRLKEFVELVLLGYSQSEIAEIMGIGRTNVTYYKNKVKQIVLMIHNPIRTSTVQLSKKLTRKTYEEKYKDQYEYSAERGCDSNESYEIVVHKEKDEYLLIKE